MKSLELVRTCSPRSRIDTELVEVSRKNEQKKPRWAQQIFNTNQKSKWIYNIEKPRQPARFWNKFSMTDSSGEHKTMYYRNQT